MLVIIEAPAGGLLRASLNPTDHGFPEGMVWELQSIFLVSQQGMDLRFLALTWHAPCSHAMRESKILVGPLIKSLHRTLYLPLDCSPWGVCSISTVVL